MSQALRHTAVMKKGAETESASPITGLLEAKAPEAPGGGCSGKAGENRHRPGNRSPVTLVTLRTGRVSQTEEPEEPGFSSFRAPAPSGRPSSRRGRLCARKGQDSWKRKPASIPVVLGPSSHPAWANSGASAETVSRGLLRAGRRERGPFTAAAERGGFPPTAAYGGLFSVL